MALIFIVEDDQNIREIECFALKNSGYSIGEFDCAKPFLKEVVERIPDLIILDIMLPDMDGLEILKKIRSTPAIKHVPVIMITAKTSEIDKVKGLDLGADDYIAKPFGVMELISRVKAILRRTGRLEEKMMHYKEICIDEERHLVSVSGTPIELTFKEYELIKLLIQNKGIVLSRDVMMERIWGTDYEGETRTIDVHIKTLRKKLGDAGKSIKTIRNVGYIVE